MYTRGPWMRRGNSIYAYGSTDTISCAVLGVIAYCESTHQSDGEGRNWSTNGSQEANARLIAAAPELLEALEDSSFWLEGALTCKAWNWDADQREAAESSLLKVKQAIKKAKGE